MNKYLVAGFNAVYSAEATPEEKQLVNDMLTVWGKFDSAAAKNPAMFRKGILFGLAMQKAINARKILIPPVREKRKAEKPQAEA